MCEGMDKRWERVSSIGENSEDAEESDVIAKSSEFLLTFKLI